MPNLAITIGTDGLQVAPGGSVSFNVEVRNLGSIVERYRCELVGLDQSWWSVTPAAIELFPQRDAEPARPGAPPSVGRFTVTVHPPRTSDAEAGVWPFGAKVTGEHDASSRLVEEGRIVVQPFDELTAQLRPEVVQGRLGATASVHLENHGNHPESIQLTGSDPTDKIRFTVRPAVTMLPAAGRTAAKVGLSLGGFRLLGSTETRPFSIAVRGSGGRAAPITLNGSFEKKALLPSGLPLAISTLVGLGLAGFAVWAAFLRVQPPAPTPPPTGQVLVATTVPTPAPATPAPTPQPTPSPTDAPTPSPTPSSTPSATPSPTPAPTARLGPSGELVPPGQLQSDDGRFRLSLLTDGSLALFRNSDGALLWVPPDHPPFVKVEMQASDGNLVFIAGDGSFAWTTGTGNPPHPGAYLELQNDGNMVISAPDGTPLWSSNQDCADSKRCTGSGS